MKYKRTPPPAGSFAEVELIKITNDLLGKEKDLDILSLLDLKEDDLYGLTDDEILEVVRERLSIIQKNNYV